MQTVKHEYALPVVKGACYFLAHVPSLVRYGSEPSRDLSKDPSLLSQVLDHLWSFDRAVAYAPNQAFIGNLDPDDLFHMPTPIHRQPIPNASRWRAFGEILPEEEFYGMMKICDEFDLIHLDEDFVKRITSDLKAHPLVKEEDLKRLGPGITQSKLQQMLAEKSGLPLFIDRDRLVGYIQDGHDEDTSLTADILLENLTSRAAGVMALRRLVKENGSASDIDYLLGCGEEAVGDRYNRGGGNLAKAIGELCGATNATGSDVKAFCWGPVHAMVLAGSLIASNLFNNVVLVAGGSLAKLGMKYHGHVHHDMPILEDVPTCMAIWITRDDGKSPLIRLDSIGNHSISSGSSQQAILEKLIVEPLGLLGLKLAQIDKYATEMHNPEVTEPQGSGNVPKTNYRMNGSFAVLRKEIDLKDLDRFVEVHGMPGFSPTQGHIASAVQVLGHSLMKMRENKIDYTMFLAKGSLFLGRMTHLSDGISFLLERDKGG